jgi:hypothetical protein
LLATVVGAGEFVEFLPLINVVVWCVLSSAFFWRSSALSFEKSHVGTEQLLRATMLAISGSYKKFVHTTSEMRLNLRLERKRIPINQSASGSHSTSTLPNVLTAATAVLGT